ncbi:MAG: efflux RND transporter permease subunit [Balneolaceae bacterium]|nr:efflux RND transporter permease subunit [Balneolaceae bacterium]
MKTGIAGRIAQAFIDSKLTPLLMAAFLGIGIYGALLTPREEEPQIDVPMADIFLGYPGASAEQVERRLAVPVEKIVSNISGVEYVYSTSMPEHAMITVQFYVGEDVERSLVKLYNELMKNMDRMPQSVSMPLVKTRSIDDVPILALTLWSRRYDDYELRRVADELNLEIKTIQDVAETRLIGGRSRVLKVELDRQAMAAHRLDPLHVARQIRAANSRKQTGSFNSSDYRYLVETGQFLSSPEEVEKLVVGSHRGKPVYLENIAEISDGPEEPAHYVSFGVGIAGAGIYNEPAGAAYPAVTLAVAKRQGTDAMRIAEQVLDKLEELKGVLIPSDIEVTVTRNYGKTASQKVAELLKHLLAAIIAVTIVVAFAMGWRGGLVVFASVPITFALTLFVYYMFGYTLNRITLFALIFVTGIVVDDSIIIAENMHRHFRMKKLPFMQAAIASINEVGNPTILATFTVIAAVLPMAFVSGLMGPYMSPMPIGASLAMIFSLLVALVITPWLAFKFLKHESEKKDREGTHKEYNLEETMLYRFYEKAMRPLLDDVKKRWVFIGGVTVLLFGSLLLFYFKMVEVKMLPFDNKNEMQVVIDMQEGTTLERTNAVAREIALALKDVPEVKNYQVYAGESSPINFNGLVRHYDLRSGANVADIQLNLVSKEERSDQSHAIAKRIRPLVDKVARKYNANAKVVEVPPGPPVLSTLVAEIYGPDYGEQKEIGRAVMDIFYEVEGVVDVDWMTEAPQEEYQLVVNREKAALTGIATQQLVQAVEMVVEGSDISQLHQVDDVNPVPIRLKMPEQDRSGIDELQKIYLSGAGGEMIPLADLVNVTRQYQEQSIHRKNQRRVVYVTADVAGTIESPIYAILDISGELQELPVPAGYTLEEHYRSQPFLQENFALKWDGEWHITYQVFRDLGAAFAIVLIIIYMLIVGWFQDFKVPVVMMIAIPLSLVGILLGHWMLGAFFTATSMIGMIALAGIMVRNSVLLVDFVKIRRDDGVPLRQAVIESGAVRTRPILLTAGTVVIGATVILFDPIFQGLAISLMGGAIASTALTLLMVPLIYYMTEKFKQKQLDLNTS